MAKSYVKPYHIFKLKHNKFVSRATLSVDREVRERDEHSEEFAVLAFFSWLCCLMSVGWQLSQLGVADLVCFVPPCVLCF